MKKFSSWWKKLSACAIAFIVIAAAYFAIGLGTLGSVQSTGRSYELQKGSSVVFKLEAKGDTQKYLKQIYFNVGTIYSEVGTTAKLRIRRTSASTPENAGWLTSYLGEFTMDNLYSDTAADKTAKGASFNWIAPYDFSSSSWSINTYRYELSATTCNVLINEVVFVADDGTAIAATVDKNFSTNVNAKDAAALVDRPYVPSLAQSTFFRFTEREAYSLMTVAEMRQGSLYMDNDIYHAETVYNALGEDFLCLGTLIFGMSPFGLRFFPFLASFGVLMIGYFFAKRLTKSDKAALVFAILYALCGLSLSLGHLGTPLMIGVFFFLASAWCCYLFYSKGMKGLSIKSAMPIALAGLFAAAAVCVNGAYVVPVVGVIALFVAGMFRQQTAKKYYLEKALEEPEVEELVEGEIDEDGEENAPLTQEERVERVKAEFRFKNKLAPVMFAMSLVFGFIVISLLALVPAYFTYVKLYDDPAAPALNLFVLLWKGFQGGFTGSNALFESVSVWAVFHKMFTGKGDVYAVTAALSNVACLAAGIAGIIFAIVSVIITLVKKQSGKAAANALRSAIIPFIGCVLTVITASFAKAGLEFILLADVFAFIMAANAFRAYESYRPKILNEAGENVRAENNKALANALFITGVVLICLCFVIIVPFIFSIPLPASWLVIL